jgi:hypothetical protein
LATFAYHDDPLNVTTSPTAYATVELDAPRKFNPFAPCGPCGPVCAQKIFVEPIAHDVAGGGRYDNASVESE